MVKTLIFAGGSGVGKLYSYAQRKNYNPMRSNLKELCFSKEIEHLGLALRDFIENDSQILIVSEMSLEIESIAENVLKHCELRNIVEYRILFRKNEEDNFTYDDYDYVIDSESPHFEQTLDNLFSE